ncbi:hypothetical protein E2542_SST31313 [Spatholobus suberectus]|nr:hypothetical protein E2542_SST31313 [Spatholobus suberectus]
MHDAIQDFNAEVKEQHVSPIFAHEPAVPQSDEDAFAKDPDSIEAVTRESEWVEKGHVRKDQRPVEWLRERMKVLRLLRWLKRAKRLGSEERMVWSSRRAFMARESVE